MHPSTNLSHLRHDKKYKDRESFGGNMYCHQRHKNEDRHQDSEYNQGKVNKPDIYIIDKIRKKIIVVKIVITRLDNLRTAE